VLTRQVCEQTDQNFGGPPRFNPSGKREMLEWTEGHWEEIGSAFTFVAASQRRMSSPQFPLFRVSEE
jgi:hypothetical protein